MTEPINAAALLPCPFCGLPLTHGSRKINPHARCTTEGCFGKKMPVVSPDVPSDVDAWNRRPAASGDLRERIAREMKIAFVERTMHSPVGQYANTIDHLFAVMAEIAIASLPGRDEEVLLDRVVKFDDCETAEPTLRQMIRQYYIQGLQPDTEHALELSGRFVRSLKTESGS